MRRGFLFVVLALALGTCAPNAAAESLYRGRGPGIRVEFRVRGGEVYFARVRTVLKCVRDDRHVRRKLGKNLGASEIRAGRFRNSSGTEEPGYGEESLLIGGVHTDEITGRFWYQRSYDTHRSELCQTGAYQSLPIRHYGRDSLRFWASRRPVDSRVRRPH